MKMSETFRPPLNQTFSIMDTPGSYTILVVEDHDDSREMLRLFLELKGYNVVEACDGEEAVDVACLVKPDLILMDLNMPKLGGLEASQKIRQCETLSNVPIFANSSSGIHGIKLFLDIAKLGTGYTEYIPKPFNIDYLGELIKTALAKSKKNEQ